MSTCCRVFLCYRYQAKPYTRLQNCICALSCAPIQNKSQSLEQLIYILAICTQMITWANDFKEFW